MPSSSRPSSSASACDADAAARTAYSRGYIAGSAAATHCGVPADCDRRHGQCSRRDIKTPTRADSAITTIAAVTADATRSAVAAIAAVTAIAAIAASKPSVLIGWRRPLLSVTAWPATASVSPWTSITAAMPGPPDASRSTLRDVRAEGIECQNDRPAADKEASALPVATGTTCPPICAGTAAAAGSAYTTLPARSARAAGIVVVLSRRETS